MVKNIGIISFFLICVSAFAFGLMPTKQQNDNNVYQDLTRLGARFGDYEDKTLAKKLFNIYYVDAKNFHEILPILEKIDMQFALSVSSTTLTENDISNLASQKHLEILNFIDCEFLPSANIIEKLSQNSNIKELSIGSHHMKQEAIKHIPKISQIESLRLIGCVIDSNDLEELPLLNIRNLDLTASILSDGCLSIITKCKTIRTINFDRCQIKNSDEITLIHNLPGLEQLDISRCSFPSSILKDFLGHPTLKTIIVHDTCFNRDDMNILSEINHIGKPFDYLSPTVVPSSKNTTSNDQTDQH